MRLIDVTTMHAILAEYAGTKGEVVCLVPHTDGPNWRRYQNTLTDATKGVGAIRLADALTPGAVLVLAFESEAAMAKWRDDAGLVSYGFAR